MLQQTTPTIPSQGRINVFDSLRFLMIFFVIVLHVSMTFMYDAPSWWYVLSNENGKIYTVMVNVFDTFSLPVLFFLSGYFTPASFHKKGPGNFFKDKFIHIAIPWISGVLFVKPLLFLFKGISLDHIIHLFHTNPQHLFFSQAHFWYLGVLFTFYIGYIIFGSINPSSSMRTSSGKTSPLGLLIFFMLISSVGFYLSSIYIAPTDAWINPISIISFKPSKIVSYLCIFILGIYAWKQYWFTERGWLPDIKIWRIAGLSSIVCYMVWSLLISPDFSIPTTVDLIMKAVLDSLTCFCMAIYIILFGIRYQTTSAFWFMGQLAPYSYGIYWLHLPVSLLFLHYIVPFHLPVFIQFILAIIFTLIVSWAISKYIFKTVPVLKSIF